MNEKYAGLTNEQVVEKALKDHGDEWVAAAMVEGSIGYHSPDHAKQLVERWRKGERVDYCERCGACYGGSLALMMAKDIYGFEYNTPEKQQAVIDYCKRLAGVDWMTATTASMLYPDHPPE